MGDVSRRQPCEVYSRVVGYLRPVSGWNKGKKQEFLDRTRFVVPGVATSAFCPIGQGG